MKLEINKFHLIDVVDGLKTLDDNSVDVIIVDPPYNIAKDFGENKDNLSIEHYVEWSNQWINECIRVLSPSGSMFIYGFSEILAYISVSLKLNKRWLIWSYNNKVVPSYVGWQRTHESIIYAWKDKPIFNLDEVRIPYTESFLKNFPGKTRKAGNSRFGNKETTYTANEKGALPRDVINIPTLAGGSGGVERYFLNLNDRKVYPSNQIKEFDKNDILRHPTQKPFKLTETLLKSSMPKENGFVVIPFGGSGSEGVVCKKLNLDFIGFDNNPDYIELSNGALNLLI